MQEPTTTTSDLLIRPAGKRSARAERGQGAPERAGSNFSQDLQRASHGMGEPAAPSRRSAGVAEDGAGPRGSSSDAVGARSQAQRQSDGAGTVEPGDTRAAGRQADVSESGNLSARRHSQAATAPEADGEHPQPVAVEDGQQPDQPGDGETTESASAPASLVAPLGAPAQGSAATSGAAAAGVAAAAADTVNANSSAGDRPPVPGVAATTAAAATGAAAIPESPVSTGLSGVAAALGQAGNHRPSANAATAGTDAGANGVSALTGAVADAHPGPATVAAGVANASSAAAAAAQSGSAQAGATPVQVVVSGDGATLVVDDRAISSGGNRTTSMRPETAGSDGTTNAPAARGVTVQQVSRPRCRYCSNGLHQVRPGSTPGGHR